MTKNKKKIYSWNIIYIFLSKIAIYLSLGLHKGRPSYRRSLQTWKKTSSTSKFEFSLLLWVILALLDPDPYSQCGSGSSWPKRCGSGSATLEKREAKGDIVQYFTKYKCVLSSSGFVQCLDTCGSILVSVPFPVRSAPSPSIRRMRLRWVFQSLFISPYRKIDYQRDIFNPN